MFEWLFGRKAAPRHTMPTVSFDSTRVTTEIRADLDATLRLTSDIPASEFARIYQAALDSVSRGRDLAVLAQALLTIEGMTKKRAGAISRLLNNRATSLMDRQRQLGLGIKSAIWRYSGASCADADDDLHSQLDGKKYSIEKGMAVGKRRVWPGMEEDCKCGSSVIIPGFKRTDF